MDKFHIVCTLPKTIKAPKSSHPKREVILQLLCFRSYLVSGSARVQKESTLFKHWYIYQYWPYHTLSPTETPCPWVSIHPRKWTWNPVKKDTISSTSIFLGSRPLILPPPTRLVPPPTWLGQILFLCGLCHDDSSTLGCLDPWDLSGFSSFGKEGVGYRECGIWARGVGWWKHSSLRSEHVEREISSKQCFPEGINGDMLVNLWEVETQIFHQIILWSQTGSKVMSWEEAFGWNFLLGKMGDL